MESNKTTKIVMPDTVRVIEGFRDTGYTFDAAIADIIDNSIGPGNATVIAVALTLDADASAVVRIADNGIGMTLTGLENAMRYGAERQQDQNSLSKFGLGLKTASTQFSKRLTVISCHQKNTDETPNAAAWDLDRVASSGDWSLELGTADTFEQDLFEEALDELSVLSGTTVNHGTLVAWDKIDRLMKTQRGTDVKNKSQTIKRLQKSLQQHLRTVFQRFLDHEDKRARNVDIYLNEEKLSPWDPFVENRGGDLVRTKEFAFEAPDGTNHTASMRAFIIPRKDEMEDLETWKEANVSLDRQGIYLYREGRLIDGPSWLGTGSPETHVNNLRVELSFEAQLDPIFGVGIKKSGVHIDDHFLDKLAETLWPIRREADKRSRAGKSKNLTTGFAAKRPTEVTLDRVKPTLRVPTVSKNSDGSIELVNKSGNVTVVGKDGTPSGLINITIDDEFADMNIIRKESLNNGVLWDMSLSTNDLLQVELNAGHEWYQKAYLPIANNTNVSQAIEYLFYAIAQAELDSTTTELREMFEEFRIDVSRNLKKLVKDLPFPKDLDRD
ncbi:ATP-binding protein [Glutamicibacter mishrai]|uniref:ATP-binding protein n=1 Tax=Glutamicibacter mishrai TaxID=1775880 RepID=UPI0020CC70D9|nr:ATP-binding protein [Glutamicibacter mishrai]UTT39438.1 ATP-binding protein [Glutamicibacter mishrai]